ncbi:MAG: ketopantoate reductase family protein, partial [Anaerolineales bacterium]
MKCLVFGAGAIGTYLGSSLALRGDEVSFYARPATAQALRANGLRITRPNGTVDVVEDLPTITDNLSVAIAQSPDVVLFALKSNDTAAALAEMLAVTATPPPLLCLQNGVDNEAEIARVFGAEQVIAGTVTTAVSKTAPGHVSMERERGV